jgi:hypothetical protein
MKQADRGTGITTRQIRAAPEGAVYVCMNGALDYTKNLSRSLGRHDIRVVSAEWLLSPDLVIRARHVPGVIDHAVMRIASFTDEQMYLIRAAQAIWND